MDIDLYNRIVEEFSKLLPQDPLAQRDAQWIQDTSRKAKLQTDRLEHELRAYRNNLIKESIRVGNEYKARCAGPLTDIQMGNEDLGNHFIAIGDMSAAFKAFSKMRDFCTTPKHIAEMTLKQLYVSIAQSNWVVAQSYYLKVNALSLSDDERTKYEPILYACVGISHLMQGAYKDAATNFILVGPSYMNPDAQAGIVFQRAVLTPNDVAVYGGLCALATMDRSELQRRVLDNGSFRQFLELEPHIRRAISLFCASKYTACMEILDSYRNDYMLDYFLQHHYTRLYWMVRSKSIVQWFSAFSVVTLDELAKAFPPTQDRAILDELVDMIKIGQLDARIDLVSNLLVSPNQDPRFAAMENALDIAKQAQRSLRLRLHNTNMAAAGLEIRPPKGQHPNGSEFFAEGGGGGSNISHTLRGMKGKIGRGSSGIGGSFMI